MSEIVTMRTLKPHRHGKSVKISGVDVKFDKLGFVDVTERHVEDLLKGGLEIVDEADLKKFAKQRELLEEAMKSGAVAPVVDLHDENAKLKVENDGLKKANEALQAKIVELEALLPVEIDNEDGKLKDDENDELIDAMKLPELKELCKGVEAPKKEWEKLKEKELKAYLKKQLKSKAKA